MPKGYMSEVEELHQWDHVQDNSDMGSEEASDSPTQPDGEDGLSEGSEEVLSKDPGVLQGQLKAHLTLIKNQVEELDCLVQGSNKRAEEQRAKEEAARLAAEEHHHRITMRRRRATDMSASKPKVTIFPARPKQKIKVDQPEDSDGSRKSDEGEDPLEDGSGSDGSSEEGEAGEEGGAKARALDEEAAMENWKWDIAYDNIQDLIANLNVQERFEILDGLKHFFEEKILEAEVEEKVLDFHESSQAEVKEAFEEDGEAVLERMDMEQLNMYKSLRRYQATLRRKMFEELGLDHSELEEQSRIAKLRAAMLASRSASASAAQEEERLQKAVEQREVGAIDALQVLNSFTEDIESTKARIEIEKARKKNYEYTLRFIERSSGDCKGTELFDLMHSDPIAEQVLDEVISWQRGGQGAQAQAQEVAGWSQIQDLRDQCNEVRKKIRIEEMKGRRASHSACISASAVQNLKHIPTADLTIPPWEWHPWRNYELFTKDVVEAYETELARIQSEGVKLAKQTSGLTEVRRVARTAIPLVEDCTRKFLQVAQQARRNLRTEPLLQDVDGDEMMLSELKERNEEENNKQEKEFHRRMAYFREQEKRLKHDIVEAARESADLSKQIEDELHQQEVLEEKIKEVSGQQDFSFRRRRAMHSIRLAGLEAYAGGHSPQTSKTTARAAREGGPSSHGHHPQAAKQESHGHEQQAARSEPQDDRPHAAGAEPQGDRPQMAKREPGPRKNAGRFQSSGHERATPKKRTKKKAKTAEAAKLLEAVQHMHANRALAMEGEEEEEEDEDHHRHRHPPSEGDSAAPGGSGSSAPPGPPPDDEAAAAAAATVTVGDLSALVVAAQPRRAGTPDTAFDSSLGSPLHALEGTGSPPKHLSEESGEAADPDAPSPSPSSRPPLPHQPPARESLATPTQEDAALSESGLSSAASSRPGSAKGAAPQRGKSLLSPTKHDGHQPQQKQRKSTKVVTPRGSGKGHRRDKEHIIAPPSPTSPGKTRRSRKSTNPSTTNIAATKTRSGRLGDMKDRALKLYVEALEQEDMAKDMRVRNMELEHVMATIQEALAERKGVSVGELRAQVHKLVEEHVPEHIEELREKVEVHREVFSDIKDSWSQIRLMMRNSKRKSQDTDEFHGTIVRVIDEALIEFMHLKDLPVDVEQLPAGVGIPASMPGGGRRFYRSGSSMSGSSMPGGGRRFYRSGSSMSGASMPGGGRRFYRSGSNASAMSSGSANENAWDLLRLRAGRT